MDQSHTFFAFASDAPAARHDGWTAERKAAFLDHLANHGDVRAACREVGISREAAYRLRRRDAVFARAWAAALVLASDAAAELLACRAINGVEEEVWHAGRLVGTRIRFDTRLLLAHIARLDRQAESAGAQDDAARFDELVALATGAEPPEIMPVDDLGVPLPLEAFTDLAVGVATAVMHDELADQAAEDGIDPEDIALPELGAAQRWEATSDAAALWHGWRGHCSTHVDCLLHGEAPPPAPATVSTVSTSSPEAGLRDGDETR